MKKKILNLKWIICFPIILIAIWHLISRTFIYSIAFNLDAYALIIVNSIIFILLDKHKKLKKFKIQKTDIFYGMSLGFILFMLLNFIPTNFGVIKPTENYINTIGMIGMFVYAIILAPYIEEKIFRQFGIDNFGNNIFSVIVTSILFSLLHLYGGIELIISTFIGGIVYGIIYLKTNRLNICIISHLVVNILTGLIMIL